MKAEIIAGTHLPLMEDFYTIQGEGFNTGKAAYFLRLGGCDVGCHWCDVKESWDADKHPLVSIEEMVQKVKNAGATRVVITGGEPLMYNLEPLTQALKNANIEVWLETSGAYSLSGTWDWICVSPKKFKSVKPEVLREAHELKVVVYNKHDFNWGNEHLQHVSPDCKLYFQPEYSKFESVMPFIIDFVKENPKWNISLQTHKFLNIP